MRRRVGPDRQEIGVQPLPVPQREAEAGRIDTQGQVLCGHATG